MIRLYDLKRGSTLVIDGQKLTFDHVDGMYSYCESSDGKIYHLPAYTPLVKVEQHYEINDDSKWQ
mgnify:FL=1